MKKKLFFSVAVFIAALVFAGCEQEVFKRSAPLPEPPPKGIDTGFDPFEDPDSLIPVADGTNIAPRFLKASATPKTAGQTAEAAGFPFANALDRNLDTRYLAGTAVTPYLELEFSDPVTAGRGGILAFGAGGQRAGRITNFSFEYWDETAGEWKTAYAYGSSGTQIFAAGTEVASVNRDNEVVCNFTDDFTSTKFRLNIIAASDAPSIWELKLYSSTEGKTALRKAVDEAKNVRFSAAVSESGSDVSEQGKWVTSAELDAYDNAIISAQKTADNRNAAAVQNKTAKTELDNATNAFKNSLKVGSAGPEFLERIAEINRKIEEAEEWLLREKTFTTDPSDYYPFEFTAAEGGRAALQKVIDAAKAKPKTSYEVMQQIFDDLQAAENAFYNKRTAGTKTLPPAGTNIGTSFSFASALDANGVPNVYQGNYGPNNGVLDNGQRYASNSPLYPLYFTIVFGDKVPLDKITLHCFGNSSAPGGGRIYTFDIEYWDGAAWSRCFRKSDAGPVGGTSSDNRQYPFLAEFTSHVSSYKYRIVVRSAQQGPSFWLIEMHYAPEDL